MKLKNYSLAAVTAAALGSLAPSVSADVITDWNLLTVNATKAAPALNSNLASRIDAIEAIAVFDAVNSIRQFGTPYHYYSPNTGSAQAAAAQAAHDVLVNYFPGQQAALDAALANSLTNLTDGPIGNGSVVGSAAAADIIALRTGDGSSPNVTYTNVVTTPGAYQLTPNIPTVTVPPFTFGPGINVQWATLKPFLIASTNQFRPGPPPALNSPQFSNDLAQVQSFGALNSVTRTPDQTHIAQFYKQDAELTVNEAARQLALANGLSLEQEALLFALTDIAEADARIAVWDAKYTYLFWRPITALNASADGTVTNAYSAWQPLIPTPNHPEYPSGHAGTVNAGFEVLKAFFGDQNTLQLHTTTAGEPPRLIQSLTTGETENVLARVYDGVHYWFSDTVGQTIGNEVANYVLAHGPHLIAQSNTNATSQLGIATYPAITITGSVGQAYRIDYATSLSPTNWTTLKFVTLPTASPYLIYDNSPGSSAQRFYRAVSVSN